MTLAPLWIVTILYAGQAVIFVGQQKLPLALMLAGYCLANLGLIWAAGR